MNSSNHSSATGLIKDTTNHCFSLNDKLERAFTIHTELIRALKTHGCSNCLQLVREIVKKYGDVPLKATHQPASNGDETFDTSYTKN